MTHISKVVATVMNTAMLVVAGVYMTHTQEVKYQDVPMGSETVGLSPVELPDVRVLLNRWSGSCPKPIYPQFDQDLLDASEEFNIEPDALFVVVKAESACDVEAIGELGEVGLGQIYPKAWKNKIPKVLELSSWNDITAPRQNLRAAAFILSDCIARKGLQKGFSCYNGRGIKAERYGASRFVEFKKFHY